MPRLATRYVDSTRTTDEQTGESDDESPSSFDGVGSLTATTPAGTCHIFPGKHSEPTEVPDRVLGAVDGIVLEEAGTRYERLLLDGLRMNEQYETVLESNIDSHRVPVFVLDIPPQGGREAYHSGRYVDSFIELIAVAVVLATVGSLGFLFGVTVALVLCVPLLMVAILHFLPASTVQRPGYVGQALRRFLAYGQVANGYSLAAARSAAVAETVDTHLLPYLEHERDAHPELFLDYGLAHLDIYTYLHHPRLRRIVLESYRWHNVTDRDWSYLDSALAFEFEGVTETNDVETIDGIRHKRVLLRFESSPECVAKDPQDSTEDV